MAFTCSGLHGGEMAERGEAGVGRLVEVPEIIAEVERLLESARFDASGGADGHCTWAALPGVTC